MISDETSSGCDGFGIAPVKDIVVEEVDKVVAAGIPVVTIDSDLASSKRDLYLGTMNAEAGKTAGRSLKDLLPGAPGTVVILGYDNPDWPDGYDRTMATKAVLEEAGYATVIRKTVWANEAEDVAAMVDAVNTAQPKVVGMIGMFENAYRCGMAVEAVGKTGQDIAVAAFDFNSKTVAYMQSGLIRVTHAQRQYYMGYLAPYVLYGMNVLGKSKTKELLGSPLVDDERFNAGLDVVNADELDQYYAFLEKLGISGS
jgi:ribose transport system substrate-binding protein